jgi:hypothetical protein
LAINGEDIYLCENMAGRRTRARFISEFGMWQILGVDNGNGAIPLAYPQLQ